MKSNLILVRKHHIKLNMYHGFYTIGIKSVDLSNTLLLNGIVNDVLEGFETSTNADPSQYLITKYLSDASSMEIDKSS